MSRLLTVMIVVLVLTGIVGAQASEVRQIDYSTYTDDDLKAVREAVDAELAKREESNPETDQQNTVYETLTTGSKGVTVRILQERLNELGYNVGKADGDYGQKTKDAILLFQKYNSLSQTGEATYETQAVLYSSDVINYEDGKKIPEPTPTPRPEISEEEYYKYADAAIEAYKYEMDSPSSLKLYEASAYRSNGHDRTIYYYFMTRSSNSFGAETKVHVYCIYDMDNGGVAIAIADGKMGVSAYNDYVLLKTVSLIKDELYYISSRRIFSDMEDDTEIRLDINRIAY